MPSLNFTVFLDKVADGTKCQTIRALRKRPFKQGDVLSFFTGMRSKKCRRLRANAVCTSAVSIAIYPPRKTAEIWIDEDKLLSSAAVNELAIKDGFAGGEEMILWFAEAHGLPFQGQLIEWTP